VNPATGELIKERAFISNVEAGDIVDQTHAAFPEWRAAGFEARAACFKKLAAMLRKDKEKFATMAALEMGKPLNEVIAAAPLHMCALYTRTAAARRPWSLAISLSLSLSRVRRSRAALFPSSLPASATHTRTLAHARTRSHTSTP
jgi:acyl-CoA reductase-like NAD-dependent aldehyde dehydrogenase